MQPSSRVIGIGLTAATERFAAELAEPASTAPSWTDFGWRMAQAAAVLHGVTPLLAGTLRWTGPEGWQAFVQEQHRQTLLRHRRIAAALEVIDERATAQGLAAVALKGAALHALGVYHPGERPMADIDLLVRAADAPRATRLLASLGYVHTGSVWKHEIFEHAQSRAQARAWKASLASVPPGEHENYPIKVELHTRIAEKLPLSEIVITDYIFPRAAVAGLNAYPSTNSLLLHLLLHATANMCGRQLRLMHLHDLARLTARMTPENWHELLRTRSASQTLWWALPPLQLLSRYQPALVPADALAALREDCPGPLRRLCRDANLSRVSYASVSITALPGLPWCRSYRERLRYAWERVSPGAEQLASRRVLATEQWTMHSAWIHLSQGRRALSWVFSRPPRQASMYIVRAALEQPPA